MIHFILLFNRQGKVRLQKWYGARSDKDKKKITRELTQAVVTRTPKMCNFIEWKDLQIVYKRYASLYFLFAVDRGDNELMTLELIHKYVEVLDRYFVAVSELDIIFNFEKAHFLLDELVLGGEIQETSNKAVLMQTKMSDNFQEEELMNMAIYETAII